MVELESNRPTVIAVDIDGVIANFVKEFIGRYNKKYHKNVKEEDVTDYNMTVMTKKKGVYKSIVHSKGFNKDMELLDTAERFKEFYRDYEVIIMTAVEDNGIIDRIDWIHRNFPDFPLSKVYIKQDKFNCGVHFDYIIEDNPAVFNNDKVIVYKQKYNENLINKGQVYAESWNDILEDIAPKLFRKK